MKKLATSLYCLFLAGILSATAPIPLSFEINWDEQPGTFVLGEAEYPRWNFGGAVFSDEHPMLPFAVQRIPIEGPGTLRISLSQQQAAPLDLNLPEEYTDYLQPQLQFEYIIEQDRGQYFAKISFCPIFKNGATFQRLTSATLSIDYLPGVRNTLRRNEYTTTSVLSEGDIYKIAIKETGIHKLTYDFLKNDLDMDIDNIDPRNIQIYGNGGGQLPSPVSSTVIDDLQENAIYIEGEADGRFNSSDYILLYAENADRWYFDEQEQRNVFEKNIYDDENYYFIKVGTSNGLRASTRNNRTDVELSVTSFNDVKRLEEDKVNLLHYWGETLGKAEGSGQNWFGDQFKNVRERDYSDNFNFPNRIDNEPVLVRASMALRSEDRSRFYLTANGNTLESERAIAVRTLVGTNDNINNFAHRADFSENLALSGDQLNISISYPYPAGAGDGSEAWLDYLEVHTKRQLIFDGNQMSFRNYDAYGAFSIGFQLQANQQNLLIWDISNPLAPTIQAYSQNGNQYNFGLPVNTTLPEFVAFDPQTNLLQAQAVGKVVNQNIHQLQRADMVIVYPEVFRAEAERLAQHRANHSKLSVAIVNIEHIYNEFASGRLDPTALRNFARMLYNRDEQFRYLLLLGDGSFDHKDHYELGNNFIPTYQRESFNPLYAFPSDDYYALLEADNAADPLSGMLNIAVGRLPAKSADEAATLVNKIIRYDQNPETLEDWRNRLVFVADDEDVNQHLRDADRIADSVRVNFGDYNIEKIYLDAYPQIATTGDDRYPEVTEAINQSIFRGSLVITYLGHGGSSGWAQERVLNISDIISWENSNRMPLFLTATCSFTGFDDPSFTTAGEETILNSKGGAIALMTTVRAVFANENAALTRETLEAIFDRPEGRVVTMGEAIANAKNSFTGSSITLNSRKFFLIGDPSQKLAIPEYKVQTTEVNETPLTAQTQDTLRALQQVTIKGMITTASGQLKSDFNGIIYPTIYDKLVTITTLGQDASSSSRDFKLQKNIIFKGRASVTNGQFSFTFVVPKDIDYQFGSGKISYYAADEQSLLDATGNYQNIIIGGNSTDGLADDQGPSIDVYMNTEDFVFGGLTDPDPLLLVKLEDDFGINVVGNSIGHDLEAVLDDDTQNSILLNSFFESELDNYQRGEVRFPLSELSEGRHSIRVKAWDVANNSSEAYTEFIVSESAGLALSHVLNYPNPFTDRTCFQFDHNYANQDLDILIQIFTVSGRLVKTIEQTLFSDGAIRQDDCIEWDGRDDFGDQLARGVYLYQVKVRANIPGSSQISGESKFEKLVILK